MFLITIIAEENLLPFLKSDNLKVFLDTVYV